MSTYIQFVADRLVGRARLRPHLERAEPVRVDGVDLAGGQDQLFRKAR
eukprot:ctg_7788.g605